MIKKTTKNNINILAIITKAKIYFYERFLKTFMKNYNYIAILLLTSS